MKKKSPSFQREVRRRIAETFPRDRLPFYRSLSVRAASSAFEKIRRVLGDEERAWHLFVLALHVFYEGWHELPSLSVAERKTLGRNARSLREIANRLRRRGLNIENDTDSTMLERMADQLEWLVCPSADGIFGLKPSLGRRFDPRAAISVLELANLFRRRLSDDGVYPVIADFMNTLPGRAVKYNVRTIKSTLAHLKAAGYRPRVQFIHTSPGVVMLKFRNVPMPSRVR